MIRFVFFLVAVLAAVPAQADGRFITLSSTTSTQDSGLFGHILPIFTSATGITVHVVAVGTGQALAIGAPDRRVARRSRNHCTSRHGDRCRNRRRAQAAAPFASR